MAKIVATRREMVKYDKHYRFLTTPGMNVYAYSKGTAHDVDDDHTISARDIPSKGFFRKKDFYIVEVIKDIDLVFSCNKFGLSGGVKVKLKPATNARGITLILLKYGKTRVEGNESITDCDSDDLLDLLQESFDEAVDKTHGDIGEEFFAALVENINKTGEFLNYDIVAESASKAE